MATEKRARQVKAETTNATPTDATTARPSPLVFISHDTRDADLAEAFGNLLTDASGGMLKSFRSSDRKGTAGIEFGSEWYASIMSKLDEATNVVALLTNHSLNRPWILYESGVAKGKLNTTVLGVAIGIKLSEASAGPFAQFQNCGDDIDSLTKLVLQLIRSIPNAQPREAAVKRQVEAFLKTVEEAITARDEPSEVEKPNDDTSVAKLFEEVKVLVRDLPSRIDSQLRDPSHRRRRKRRYDPRLIDEAMMRGDITGEYDGATVGLLIATSYLRDDLPWIYELAVDLHRAIRESDERRIATARESLTNALEMLAHRRMFDEFATDDHDAMYILHHLYDLIHIATQKKTGKAKSPIEK